MKMHYKSEFAIIVILVGENSASVTSSTTLATLFSNLKSICRNLNNFAILARNLKVFEIEPVHESGGKVDLLGLDYCKTKICRCMIAIHYFKF